MVVPLVGQAKVREVIKIWNIVCLDVVGDAQGSRAVYGPKEMQDATCGCTSVDIEHVIADAAAIREPSDVPSEGAKRAV